MHTHVHVQHGTAKTPQDKTRQDRTSKEKETRKQDRPETTRTTGAAAGLNQPVRNWSAECTLRPAAGTADGLERHYPENTRQTKKRNRANHPHHKPHKKNNRSGAHDFARRFVTTDPEAHDIRP